MAVHAVLADALGIAAAPPEVGLGVLAERRPAQQDGRLLLEDADAPSRTRSGPRSGLTPDITAHAAVRASISQTPLPFDADLGAVVVDGAEVAVASPGLFQGLLERSKPAGGSSPAGRGRPSARRRRPSARGCTQRKKPSQTLSPLPLTADLVEAVVPVAGARSGGGRGPPCGSRARGRSPSGSAGRRCPRATTGAGRTPFRACPAGRGAKGCSDFEVAASARRGAIRRRSPRDTRPRPRPARGGCPRRASGPTKPVRPSWRRWNQWTTSPSRNCCEACSRICRRASAGSIQIRFTESWSWSRKPIRPARLVEAPPRPDPLGQRLVLQPVEVAVELRVAGLDRDRIHQAQPPAPGLFQAGQRRRRVPIPADDRLRPRPVVGLAEDHDDRASRPAPGHRSVVRNAATGRSSPVGAGSRLAAFDQGGMGDDRAGAEESAPRGLDQRRPGTTWRRTPGQCGTCCAGSRRRGHPSAVVVADLQRAGVLRLVGQHHLEVGSQPQSPGAIRRGS